MSKQLSLLRPNRRALFSVGVLSWILIGPGLASLRAQESQPAIAVGGAGTFGALSFGKRLKNEVLGKLGPRHPGLNHEWWFTAAEPEDLASLRTVFRTEPRVRIPFTPEYPSSWWTGSQHVIDGAPNYPDEITPLLADRTNADSYAARLTGQIFLPESGVYRFADAVDEFSYLALDIDRSGAAGDSEREVLVNNKQFTSVSRSVNSGGRPIAAIGFDVADGGEWRSIEVAMAEGGGMDGTVLYWDYDVLDGDGDGVRIADATGFPQSDSEAINMELAPQLYIPNTHLRAIGLPELVHADLVGTLQANRLYDVEVNGLLSAADVIPINNPDRQLYTSVLEMNSATVRLISDPKSLRVGDVFHIADADRIEGPTSFLVSHPAVIFDTSRFLTTGDVEVVAIPEPPGVLLISLAILALSSRRR